MGRNYSLSAIFHRAESSDLLKHLSAILDPDAKSRIENLPWSPAVETTRKTMIGTMEVDAQGVAGLEHRHGDFEYSYFFPLWIQLEEEMKLYLDSSRLDCFDHPGSLDTLWTSIDAGSKYVIIKMTASRTQLSSVFINSKTIQDLWSGFALESNAIVAYIDLEENGAIQLFPNKGNLVLPDDDTLVFVDSYDTCVDHYAQYILNYNRIT